MLWCCISKKAEPPFYPTLSLLGLCFHHKVSLTIYKKSAETKIRCTSLKKKVTLHRIQSCVSTWKVSSASRSAILCLELEWTTQKLVQPLIQATAREQLVNLHLVALREHSHRHLQDSASNYFPSAHSSVDITHWYTAPHRGQHMLFHSSHWRKLSKHDFACIFPLKKCLHARNKHGTPGTQWSSHDRTEHWIKVDILGCKPMYTRALIVI